MFLNLRHLLWIAFGLRLIEAIDKSKFKSCATSSFCRRYRTWKELTERPILEVKDVSSFIDDIAANNCIVNLKVKSSAEVSLNYGMNITFFEDVQALRVQIYDVSSNISRERYRIPDGDVVIHESGDRGNLSLAVSVCASVSKSPGETVINHPSGYMVKVSHSPMKISLYNNQGNLVQVINSRNFFAFERFREKSATDLCPAGVSMDMACHEKVDVTGLWEESFNGFIDEKPYGPSAVGIDVELVNARAVFGLAEHTTSFNLPVFTEGEGPPDEEYRFYNSDVFEYEIGSKVSIYGSIPMITVAHEEGYVSGFLWLNPSESFVSLSRRQDAKESVESSWVSETGIIDMFFFAGPTPRDVLKQFYRITGNPTFLPMFALGHHQSKWGYGSQEEVLSVNRDFDEFEIPLDVLWLDIQHTRENRYMTWNSEFSDPAALLGAAAASGRQVVAIVDPHIKVDGDFSVYAGALKKDLFVKQTKNQSSTDFIGYCWPGNSSYFDVTRSAFREYWATLFRYESYNGSAPNLWIWNDMNEPSVFNGPEMSLPRTVRFGNTSETEHREMHNLYGQYYHRATFEALLARGRSSTGRRPFVLTRSFFAGSHRFGPVWTGDNQAQWSHLKASVAMLLSLAVCGMPFSGADVGGFLGHPDRELFIRWHQLGAMAYPFYRSHAHIDSPRREPWTFDEQTLALVRSAINLRYSLLPYWYTASARQTLEGLPMIRPLWFDHIGVDYNTVTHPFATEEQIQVGDSLIVRGVFEPNIQHIETYLPGPGIWWYDFNSFESAAAPVEGGRVVSQKILLDSMIPVFVKAGTIVPLKITRRQSTVFQKWDPITLQIWPDMEGKASGLLYLDDEESFAFRDSDDYAMIQMDFVDNELSFTRIGGKRSLSSYYLSRVKVAGPAADDRPPVYVQSIGDFELYRHFSIERMMHGQAQNVSSARKPRVKETKKKSQLISYPALLGCAGILAIALIAVARCVRKKHLRMIHDPFSDFKSV